MWMYTSDAAEVFKLWPICLDLFCHTFVLLYRMNILGRASLFSQNCLSSSWNGLKHSFEIQVASLPPEFSVAYFFWMLWISCSTSCQRFSYGFRSTDWKDWTYCHVQTEMTLAVTYCTVQRDNLSYRSFSVCLILSDNSVGFSKSIKLTWYFSLLHHSE